MRIQLITALALAACASAVKWEPDPSALAAMSFEEKARADSVAADEARWRRSAAALDGQSRRTAASVTTAVSEEEITVEMVGAARQALKGGDQSAAADVALLEAQKGELRARTLYLEKEQAWLEAKRDLCLLRADSCHASLLYLQAQATGAPAGVRKGLANEMDDCCEAIEAELRKVVGLEREKDARHRAWQVLRELWEGERDSRARIRG